MSEAWLMKQGVVVCTEGEKEQCFYCSVDATRPMLCCQL
jgi:hypothetical protein